MVICAVVTHLDVPKGRTQEGEVEEGGMMGWKRL